MLITTPAAKPHISLMQPIRCYWDYGRLSFIWTCDGEGRRGYGTEPEDAYYDWLSHFEKVW